MSFQFRIGLGYDIHPLVEGKKLILGGVHIFYEKGLMGHSDADCLSHAIADAILGAAGLPDIGYYFPNTDPQYKGMSSQDILKKVCSEVAIRGYKIVNIDSTIIAEQPKIMPYVNRMKEELAKSLSIPITAIGIKATTNERLDDLGQGLGIAAHAVCLLSCRSMP